MESTQQRTSVNEGTFECRNDLSCFSFSFQQRIRQGNKRKVFTKSDQFSFKEKEKEAEFNILRLIYLSGIVWSEDTMKKDLHCTKLVGVVHFNFTPIS